MSEVADSKFKGIFLSKWMPAVITATIGGVLVAVLAPWLQTKYSAKAEVAERRVELWESIGSNFTNYINQRSRLNSAARWQYAQPSDSPEVTKDFLARKEEYRKERDRYADALKRDFLLARFYYGDDVSAVLDEFLEWHVQFRVATVEHLPPDSAYSAWRDKVMLAIRADLK